MSAASTALLPEERLLLDVNETPCLLPGRSLVMEYIIFIIIPFFGLIIGSFLNVLIWRVHIGASLLGRSRCVHCTKTIPWYDNIPLVSFCILRGRCRFCKKNISLRYPLMELSTAVVFLLAFFASENVFFFLRNIFFLSMLLVIFAADFLWMEIPDAVTLPGIALAFLANLLLGYRWQDLALGAIIGGGFFLLQYLVSAGRWIGGGDIRLGALMGAMLGALLTLAALVAAYLLGALGAVFLLLCGKKKLSEKVPFGTSLAFSTAVMLLFGAEIVQWYKEAIVLLL